MVSMNKGLYKDVYTLVWRCTWSVCVWMEGKRERERERDPPTRECLCAHHMHALSHSWRCKLLHNTFKHLAPHANLLTRILHYWPAYSLRAYKRLGALSPSPGSCYLMSGQDLCSMSSNPLWCWLLPSHCDLMPCALCLVHTLCL